MDDSIVRGTTIANLIRMLKEAGALEVHVRISSPPFLHPCYFGTDVPSNDQLIAAQHSTEEICKMIGADSLGYMADRLSGRHGRWTSYCAKHALMESIRWKFQHENQFTGLMNYVKFIR